RRRIERTDRHVAERDAAAEKLEVDVAHGHLRVERLRRPRLDLRAQDARQRRPHDDRERDQDRPPPPPNEAPHASASMRQVSGGSLWLPPSLAAPPRVHPIEATTQTPIDATAVRRLWQSPCPTPF